MPTIKPNVAEKVLGKIFQDPTVIYGFKEFEHIQASEVLHIFEDGQGVYYLHDLKSGNPRFVLDEKKQKSRPEEIVRQLWLYKLHKGLK